MSDLLKFQQDMLGHPRSGFFDYDVGKTWFFYSPHWSPWDDTIDLVRLEAHRLHAALPKLGNRAVIVRSSLSGWHLIFPDANITWKENLALLFFSRAHRGFVSFSLLVTDCTLRVGEKLGANAPYVVEVIYFD